MTIWQTWPRVLVATTLFVGTQAVAQSDQDSDGIADNADNCLLAANASQLDSNADGFGNACDPDLDDNGTVNFLDLQQMQDAFFTTPASPNWNPDADLDGSNVINFADLQVMKDLFFAPPGPVGVVRWVNPASGYWNEPTNWFPVGVPIDVNIVLIDTPGIVVTHRTGDLACSGVLSMADIVLADGSRLSVFGDMDMQGSLIMTNANTTLANARVFRSAAAGGGDPLIFEDNVKFENITLGLDLIIPNSFTISFENGLTLDDTSLTLISNGSFTEARFLGTQTIGGTGEILFGGTTAADNLNRIFPHRDGDVLTIDSGVTVRTLTTGGWLGNNSAGRGLTVLGDVVADVDAAEITVQGDTMSVGGMLTASNGGRIQVDGDWIATDMATMTANDGSELELFGNWSSAATITVTNGLLDIGNNNTSDTWTNLGAITLVNSDAELGGVFGPADIGNITSSGILFLNGRLVLTGLVFDLDMAPGTWQLDTNGIIQDGTVTGTLLEVVGAGDFDGTTLNVDTVINTTSIVDIVNGLTLDNASFTLVSNGSLTRVRARGAQTIGGIGEILYGGTTTDATLNRLYPSEAGEVLTIGSGITVRPLTTGGWLGTDSAERGLTMLGSVVADVVDAKITVQGDPLTISGSLTASDGGEITVDGQWIASNTATMNATGGSELELFGNWSSEAIVNVTDGLLDIGENNISDSWTNLGIITLINSDAELGGVFVPDDIGSMTIDGTTTLTGRLILTGLVFDIDAGPGTWQLGQSGIFQDGTVTGTLLNVVGHGEFDGTTLSVDTVINETFVRISNGLTLDNVSLTLISNDSGTLVRCSGSQTIDGTGEILFGGSSNTISVSNKFEPGSSDELTIGAGITVRTSTTGGRLGTPSGGGRLTILGAVVANVAGALVTVQGDLLTLAGSLSGSNGAVITIDGNWIASTTATITMTGGSLRLFGSWSSEATITATDSNLDVGIGFPVDTWTNLGSIDLVNTDATFGGVFSQSDLGSITSDSAIIIDGLLNNAGQTLNIDTLPGTWQLGSSGTISGGTIAGTLLEVTGTGADLDGVILSADLNLTSTNDLYLLNGLTLDNATVTLGSNSELRAQGTQTIGGIGQILFGGDNFGDHGTRIFQNAQFSTLTIGPGVTVASSTSGGQLGGTSARGLTLQGTVLSSLAGRTVTVQGEPLSISGNATASAGGRLLINGDWNAGPTATISSNGGSELELSGQWVNNGLVSVTNSLLDIGGNWINLGIIDLVDSDTELGGVFMFADLGIFTSNADVIIGGELDNTGLTVDLDTLSATYKLGDDGKIIGGTIAGTNFDIIGDGDLDGVTLAVDTTFANGVRSDIFNGLTLDNASLTLASDNYSTALRFVGSQTLGGIGEVLFGGTTDFHQSNRIEPDTSSSTTLTIGPNITIRPLTIGGVVGQSGSSKVTLQGSIVSDMGEEITIGGRPFRNDGTIVIGAGSTVAGFAEYVQGPGGSMQIEISGNSDFGQLALTGGGSSVELDGTLDIVLSGYAPVPSDTFEIVSAVSRTGSYSTVNGTDAGSGLTFVPIYNPNNVTLDVQ